VTPGTEGPRGIIEKITDGSGRNPFLVGLLCLIAACAGVYALVHVSLDAVPDLSDVQVIVYTDWEGRNPSLVEDQVTYPITSKFLGAPRIKAVRGLSMFGRSFVYVIFEDPRPRRDRRRLGLRVCIGRRLWQDQSRADAVVAGLDAQVRPWLG
jgi:hypothetical protein